MLLSTAFLVQNVVLYYQLVQKGFLLSITVVSDAPRGTPHV